MAAQLAFMLAKNGEAGKCFGGVAAMCAVGAIFAGIKLHANIANEREAKEEEDWRKRVERNGRRRGRKRRRHGGGEKIPKTKMKQDGADQGPVGTLPHQVAVGTLPQRPVSCPVGLYPTYVFPNFTIAILRIFMAIVGYRRDKSTTRQAKCVKSVRKCLRKIWKSKGGRKQKLRKSKEIVRKAARAARSQVKTERHQRPKWIQVIEWVLIKCKMQKMYVNKEVEKCWDRWQKVPSSQKSTKRSKSPSTYKFVCRWNKAVERDHQCNVNGTLVHLSQSDQSGPDKELCPRLRV
jgi:hypothetical protein